MSGLCPSAQQAVMPDSDKAFRRYMHKKAADKFDAGYGTLFPITFFTVVFHIVGDSIFIHAVNTVVADGNPVGVFPKVVNNGLCSVVGLLAVGNPILFIAKV